MDTNEPECSHSSDNDQVTNQEQLKEDFISERLPTNKGSVKSLPIPETPKSFMLASTLSQQENEFNDNVRNLLIPEIQKSFMLASTLSQQEGEFQDNVCRPESAKPLVINPSYQSVIICQPRSNLQLASPNRPPSLFLQALTRLNESSHNLAGLSPLKLATATQINEFQTGLQLGDITPPDSLTSAPPSYSFVLQQMAARRRPRLMGTFIPSPSFVQHTPPPNYSTAFDIYVDNRLPPPPVGVNHFGFAPMIVICPECGSTGLTIVTSKITLCTHLSAFILCLFCCWICVPIPYIIRACKDVYHYCRSCRTFLGVYCPTNPDANYP